MYTDEPDSCSQRAKNNLAKSLTSYNTKGVPKMLNSRAHDERKARDLSGGECDGFETEQGTYDLFTTPGLFAQEAGGDTKDTPATRSGVEGAN